MSELEVQRIIGRLEQMALAASKGIEDARIEQRDAKRELERRLDEQDKKLGEISATLQEARGGWRVLMFIAGAAGGLGAAVTAFLKGQFGT